jgi:hypothetical protein
VADGRGIEPALTDQAILVEHRVVDDVTSRGGSRRRNIAYFEVAAHLVAAMFTHLSVERARRHAGSPREFPRFPTGNSPGVTRG